MREKKEIIEKHAPQESSLKDIIRELHDEEEREMLEFKRE
jgi:hypothetical protein